MYNFIESKLIDYGFKKNNNEFVYTTNIVDGNFNLIVTILNNQLTTKVFDVVLGDEYILHKVDGSVGEFVGSVRSELENITLDIIKKCTKNVVYTNSQTLRLIDYVTNEYNIDLEFLWHKFPQHSIWRRKDNSKWFGLFGIVSGKKIGLNSNELVEILDVRMPFDDIVNNVDNISLFPGYHMNKKHWVTVVLDERIDDKTLFKLIDDSYILAKDK